MTTAREPPPPEVQNHPRFCRGAGHAGRFRLRPEITFERFLERMAQAHTMMPKPIGLTSFRILRFDDGSFLHRMTFVSVAAWKRHSAQMDQTNAISHMMHAMLDLEHSEIWMGMFTLIPARYAPDLDHPAAPRPSNPCEIEHGLQTAAADNSDDDDGALPDGSIRDEDDCDDDLDTASSIVSLSVTVNATDRRHARRLPSIGSVRSAAAAASSSSSPAVDVLSPSPSDFLNYQSVSTVAQPPSRAYTEARSSAGLTPERESPYGAAGHRGGVNFSSYWRSAAWSAPSAAPASVPRVPDPYFSPSTSRRVPRRAPSSPPPSSDSRAARTKLKGLPREMVHHMPEACYTILPPSAGPREEASPDDAKLGFTIVIDGDPTHHFRSVASTTAASKKQPVIYLPAAGQPAASRETKLQQHQQQLSKPQPPTEEALASTTGRASSAGAGSSSDDHNHGATRGSTPTSVTCTVGDDDPVIPESTVVSASLSTTSTSKAASTAPSRGIRGGQKKAPVLCVLVAFTDDKKKKKCRLDTAVCPEPHPGQVVTVRDGIAPSGGDPSLRPAKVLTVTPWSTRKGGGNSGSIAAPPAVVGIMQAS